MKNILFWFIGIILFFIIISFILELIIRWWIYYFMFIDHINIIWTFNIIAIIDMLIIVVWWYIFWSFMGNKYFKLLLILLSITLFMTIVIFFYNSCSGLSSDECWKNNNCASVYWWPSYCSGNYCTTDTSYNRCTTINYKENRDKIKCESNWGEWLHWGYSCSFYTRDKIKCESNWGKWKNYHCYQQ